MAAIEIQTSFQVFYDLNGSPLEGGYIYIGAYGQNPETSAKAVFWDSGLTLPAANPIRTVSGAPTRNGAPSTIFTDGSYSITVRDSAKRLVYSSGNGLTAMPIAAGGTGASTAAGALVNLGATIVGNAVFVAANDAAARAAIMPNSYAIRQIVTLTTGVAATYTPPSWVRAFKAKIVGAGGGSGAVDGQGAGTAGVGGAGGGGGWAEKLITNMAQTFTYTIGAGGVAGPAGAAINTYAGDGGTTTFTGSVGGVMTATGGVGGENEVATSGNNSSASGSNGTSTGGDINGGGSPSVNGLAISGSIMIPSASGASSWLGGSVKGVRATNAAGITGAAYGAGAAGATVTDVTTNFAGAVGANGVIVLELYE